MTKRLSETPTEMIAEPELPADVRRALEAGRKLDAIRLLRKQRGLGLGQAKSEVEAYARANPQSVRRRMPRTDSGLARLIVVGVAVAVAYAVYSRFGQ